MPDGNVPLVNEVDAAYGLPIRPELATAGIPLAPLKTPPVPLPYYDAIKLATAMGSVFKPVPLGGKFRYVVMGCNKDARLRELFIDLNYKTAKFEEARGRTRSLLQYYL